MRLSLRNMLISFAISLVIFSIAMTCICVGIYQSRIHDRIAAEVADVSHTLPSYQCRYNFSKTSIYLDGSAEFSLSALIAVDEKEKLIIITPFLSELPINYKNGIYFVSSILKAEGDAEISEIVSALTGVTTKNFLRKSFLSEDLGETIEGLIEYFSRTNEGYTVQVVEVLLDENGVADNHKTKEQFFTLVLK